MIPVTTPIVDRIDGMVGTAGIFFVALASVWLAAVLARQPAGNEKSGEAGGKTGRSRRLSGTGVA
ncbi:hypothetical protein [Salinarimonas ramus]|nr:hypothetical protein [Salinarimonas ramus]